MIQNPQVAPAPQPLVFNPSVSKLNIVAGFHVLASVPLKVVNYFGSSLASAWYGGASFNGVRVGHVHWVCHDDDTRTYYISERAKRAILALGYNAENPASTNGVVFSEEVYQYDLNIYALDHVGYKFLPCDQLTAIFELMLTADQTRLSQIVRYMTDAGLSQTQAMNQIRFSFLFLIDKFRIEYGKIDYAGLYAPTPQTQKIFNLGIRLQELLEAPKPAAGFFNCVEDLQVTTMMAIQMNAKEFNSENYDKATKKQISAFYKLIGAPFSEASPSRYLNHIFPKEDVELYHDYLPKVIRKLAYTCIKGWTDTKIKPYLFGTLMEYTGMSLIRETYRVLMEGPARNFMFMDRYIDEITLFVRWHNENCISEDFKYYWYSNPEKLEQVCQAKCVNLYSAVLKILRAGGLMVGYKSTILRPDLIPPEDTDYSNMYI